MNILHFLSVTQCTDTDVIVDKTTNPKTFIDGENKYHVIEISKNQNDATKWCKVNLGDDAELPLITTDYEYKVGDNGILGLTLELA